MEARPVRETEGGPMLPPPTPKRDEKRTPPPVGRDEGPLTPSKIRAIFSEQPPLKFAPHFQQNFPPTKKTLEICEIGLGKHEGLPKRGQENFGKAVFWAEMNRVGTEKGLKQD